MSHKENVKIIILNYMFQNIIRVFFFRNSIKKFIGIYNTYNKMYS